MLKKFTSKFRLTLRFKIGGGFALLVVIAMLMAFIGYKGLSTIEEKSRKSNEANSLKNMVSKIKDFENRYILTGNIDYIVDANDVIQELIIQTETEEENRNESSYDKALEELSAYASKYKSALDYFSTFYERQREQRNTFITQEKNILNNLNSTIKLKSQLLSDSANTDLRNYNSKLLNNLYDLENIITDIGKQKRDFIINLQDIEKQAEYTLTSEVNFKNAKNILDKFYAENLNEEDNKYINTLLVDVEALENTFSEIIETELSKIDQQNVMMEAANKFEELATMIHEDEMANMNKIQASALRNLYISAMVAFLLGSALTILITNSITRPILAAIGFAQEIARGNLSTKVPIMKSKDEIGTLISALKEMHENLKNMTKQVIDASNQVKDSSHDVVLIGNRVSEISSQVDIAIQHIAEGAESQVSLTTDTVKNVEHLIEEISNVNKKTGEMSDIAYGVINNIAEGMQAVDKSIGQMRTIDTNVKESTKTVQLLHKKTIEVSEIVNLIDNIADQTNLLALNAAIEAARAGVHGRGFTIVADEVRKLAEQSSRAADEIMELIKEIQNMVSSAVGKVEKSTNEVENGVNIIEDAGQIFKKISKMTKNLFAHIEEVSNSSEDMSYNSLQTRKAINEVVEVSEEFASGAEEVAASSQEQITAMQSVVDASNELVDVSTKLTESVAKFKL